MDAGKFPQEDGTVLQIIDTETKPVGEGKPETHKQNIDIQVLVSGQERIGFCRKRDGIPVAEP